jgi:hypothetical protein
MPVFEMPLEELRSCLRSIFEKSLFPKPLKGVLKSHLERPGIVVQFLPRLFAGYAAVFADR